MRMVLLSQKTEVKQRGPGLPHAAQTKRMLWGSTVDSFLIQETCWSGWDSRRMCFYWWIPQFASCSLLFPPRQARHAEMSACPISFFTFFLLLSVSLGLTQGKWCFFANAPNTSASTHTHTHGYTHTHTHTYQYMQTFWCDPLIIFRCSVIGLFWLKNWPNNCSLDLCTSVVVSMTSFHFRYLIVRATWFHYHDTNYRNSNGKKNPVKHHSVLCLCCWETIMRTFFSPLVGFFFL